MSLVVISEILLLFGNRLTADHMYSRHRWEKFWQKVQTLLSQKLRKFLPFLLHYWNLQKILLILKEKITFTAYIFPKLLTRTNVVTSMPVISCFRTPFTNKGVHRSQKLLKAAIQRLHLNFPLISEKVSCRTSSLVKYEILGPFGNTLTADHMYSRHRSEKLRQKDHRLLSQKWRRFSGIFTLFSECRQNCPHSEKKN